MNNTDAYDQGRMDQHLREMEKDWPGGRVSYDKNDPGA